MTWLASFALSCKFQLHTRFYRLNCFERSIRIKKIQFLHVDYRVNNSTIEKVKVKGFW